jgi:Polyketide cyclase / dehydrase and lipid transport
MLAAMARVEGVITVSRPVDAVFDFVADECNEPRYNAPTVRAEQISEGPIGEGARFYTELRMMGRTMPMVVEFTGYERPSRLASVTRSPMMRTEGALTFEPVDEGTRIHWSWDVRPRGAMKLMAPLVGMLGPRQERETLGQPQAVTGVGRRWVMSTSPLVPAGNRTLRRRSPSDRWRCQT